MTKLIGLFSNQKEAEEAVNALAESVLDDRDIRVMSQWSDELNRTLEVLPVSHPTSGLSGVVGPSAYFIAAAPCPGDEATRFFEQAMKKGAVLVAVQLSDDEYVDRAKSILEEQQAVAAAVVS